MLHFVQHDNPGRAPKRGNLFTPLQFQIPLPVQRLSIFSILGPERAKKLSIGVHGLAENRENRQSPSRERVRVRAVSTQSLPCIHSALEIASLIVTHRELRGIDRIVRPDAPNARPGGVFRRGYSAPLRSTLECPHHRLRIPPAHLTSRT